MTLTPEEKAERIRQRMIEKANEDKLATYAGKVAVVFQKMIRAEAGAQPAGWARAYGPGDWNRSDVYRVNDIWRNVGHCVCVTCGKVLPWTTGTGSMQTGHFDHGRSHASLLFEEDGVAPQCSFCNKERGGADADYTQWMLAVRGKEVVERLKKLKHTVRRFTFEELVDMKIEYAARLKAAIERMESQ